MLDEVGLSSALQWYVDGFAERSRIDATLELPPDLQRFPAEMEIAIFRAVQESLTNVHRHSASASCSVKVVQTQHELQVEVKDRGKGIALGKQSSLVSSSGGVGLRGMRERLRQLGGTLEIKSSENGTTVLVTLPIASTATRSEGAA